MMTFVKPLAAIQNPNDGIACPAAVVTERVCDPGEVKRKSCAYYDGTSF
jgi:hypothetical protein